MYYLFSSYITTFVSDRPTSIKKPLKNSGFYFFDSHYCFNLIIRNFDFKTKKL